MKARGELWCLVGNFHNPIARITIGAIQLHSSSKISRQIRKLISCLCQRSFRSAISLETVGQFSRALPAARHAQMLGCCWRGCWWREAWGEECVFL